MVAEAEAHARDRGVKNVTFRAGDFRSAGLPERSFDVVHAHQVLQHLRDPVGALREMGRLAGSRGMVVAAGAVGVEMSEAERCLFVPRPVILPPGRAQPVARGQRSLVQLIHAEDC